MLYHIPYSYNKHINLPFFSNVILIFLMFIIGIHRLFLQLRHFCSSTPLFFFCFSPKNYSSFLLHKTYNHYSLIFIHTVIHLLLNICQLTPSPPWHTPITAATSGSLLNHHTTPPSKNSNTIIYILMSLTETLITIHPFPTTTNMWTLNPSLIHYLFIFLPPT